jgi:hypothetical protein
VKLEGYIRRTAGRFTSKQNGGSRQLVNLGSFAAALGLIGNPYSPVDKPACRLNLGI